jgi:hypothetical protein
MGYLATVFLVIGGLVPRSAWYYVPIQVVGLVGMMLILGIARDEASRRRARRGLPDCWPKEPPTWRHLLLVRMGGNVLLVAGPVVLLTVLGVGDWEWRVKVPLAALGLAGLVRGAWYRRWEDVIADAAVVGLVALAMAMVPDLALPLLFGSACIPVVLAGLVKHVRWWRWARSVAARAAGGTAAHEGTL